MNQKEYIKLIYKEHLSNEVNYNFTSKQIAIGIMNKTAKYFISFIK